MRIKSMVAALSVCLLALSASAQQGTGLSGAYAALERGEYLHGLDLLHVEANSSPDSRNSPALGSWRQMMPAMTGVPDMRFASQAKADLDPATVRQLQAARLPDAVAEIVRRARNTRIVILNEAHDSPRDRAFALQVARALRPLGYSYLAVETFANDPGRPSGDPTAAMARDGYPRLSQGFYLKDPVFGDFVRQSLALGYRPVAYEHMMNRGPGPTPIPVREQGQSDNLVAAIFKEHPDARVLIHVGYSHAAERPLSGGMEWMASRLAKATGVDPLTIDQTVVSEYADDPGSRAYHALVAKRGVRTPVVMMSGDMPLTFAPYAGAVDLQVVHPLTQIRQGRPTWLASMGRQPVAIPARLLPRTAPRLIQAFIASEAEDAIPVDQILVHPGKPAPVLMLPRVPIRYAFQDSACAAPPKGDAGECAAIRAADRADAERLARRVVFAQAMSQSDRRDFAGALKTFNKALAVSPDDMQLLSGRGMVHAKANDAARAERDFARVRAATAKADDLNELCWVKATQGIALESALADCNAALAKEPNETEFIDSRAFVLLRLGRLDEAIADYDRALAGPKIPSGSRYGRAIARARKGDKAGSQADLEAALKANPGVRAEFQRYGVTL